jgi:hypothetical protein
MQKLQEDGCGFSIQTHEKWSGLVKADGLHRNFEEDLISEDNENAFRKTLS